MKDKIVPVLVIALVFFAFLSGGLWSRVRQTNKEKETEEVQQAEQQQQQPELPQVLGAEDQAEIIKNPTAVKGAETSKVTIVEFSEYQCPYCKKYVDEAYTKIMQNYGNQIRYIFRDYPLPFHQHAQQAAEAARCAGDQGKYWEYHDKLFGEQENWSSLDNSKDKILEYAANLGLNKETFQACLESGKHTAAVKADFSLGQKVGVQGTPSFFINGQRLVGAMPYESFEAVIKAELEK